MTARPQQHRITEVTTRANLPAWQTIASCLGKNTDLWFPSSGERGTEAKRVCRSCPVQEPCLEFGLDQPEGIWGGEDIKGKQRIRRQRKA